MKQTSSEQTSGGRTTVIHLETSDFTAETQPDGRVRLYVYGGAHDVELDLDPDVRLDLIDSLRAPEEPS